MCFSDWYLVRNATITDIDEKFFCWNAIFWAQEERSIFVNEIECHIHMRLVIKT